MTRIPLPRLYQPDGTTFVRDIRPVKVTAELNIIPLSTASIQMPEGEGLPARSYVEVFTAMGSAGFFRVRSPQDSYGEDVAFAELEHAVVEVGDWLVRESIRGMMTAGEAFSQIFGHYRGTLWTMEPFSLNWNVAVDTDHDTVLSAMLAVLDQIPNYRMDFDFSDTPWVIRFRANDTAVRAEGRLSRNVQSARVTYDDSELCTRAYYELQTEDMQGMPISVWHSMNADTISTYGVVERLVNVDIDSTPDEALRAINTYLRKHKQPVISVEIDAEELSQITGEMLDTFQIGKLFRLAIPSHGVTVERNITGLIYDDVYGQPRQITVKLADELDTVVSFLHDVAAGSGTTVGAGSGSKKQNDKWKEYYTGLQQTDYFWDMYARKVNENGDILRQAGLYIDANGVLQYADDNENMLYARLQVTASYIRGELNDVYNELRSTIVQTASYLRSDFEDTANGLYSHIEQTAAYLRTDFEDTASGLYSHIEQTASHLRTDFEDVANGLYSHIEQTAEYIRSDVEDTACGLRSQIEQTASRVSVIVDGNGNIKPAQIVASINNGSSTIKLSADHIDIDGLVESLEAKDVMVRYFNAANGEFTEDLNVLGDLAVYGDVTSGGYQLSLADASVSGNTLTITKVDGSTVTFRRVASLSGGWSGNTYTVSASPSGIVSPVSTELLSLSGSGSPTVTGQLVSQLMNIMIRGSGSTPVASGAQLTAVIDASAVYSSGYNSGHSDGVAEGYADGYQAGESDGYSSGYWDGYPDGEIEGLQSAEVAAINRGWNSYSGMLPDSRTITIRAWNSHNTSIYDDIDIDLRLYRSGNTVYLQHYSGGSWTSVAMSQP